ncbi:MAG: helix-turn-helix domain-containing protein [Rikenellaceae bacterium]
MSEIITAREPQIENFFVTLNKVEEGITAIIESYKAPFNGERYYTDYELSNHLHISRRTLQEWRNNGRIAFIQLDGKVLYSETAIQNLLNKHYRKEWDF